MKTSVAVATISVLAVYFIISFGLFTAFTFYVSENKCSDALLAAVLTSLHAQSNAQAKVFFFINSLSPDFR